VGLRSQLILKARKKQPAFSRERRKEGNYYTAVEATDELKDRLQRSGRKPNRLAVRGWGKDNPWTKMRAEQKKGEGAAGL